MNPLLSIVIANYNYGRFLEAAIQSVLSQIGTKNGAEAGSVELIICDAASTDNSVDIIRKYAGDLPPNTPLSQFHPSFDPQSTLQSANQAIDQSNNLITWWCSEKDGGQSAAFNKGFVHARGKYLTWLNADDILVPGALAKVVKAFKEHPECDWFCGNTYRFANDGRIVNIWWGPHWYPSILQRKSAPVCVYGPSTFFSRRLYDEVGAFREDLHYIMDIDMWRRFIVRGVKQRRLNFFCWGFRMHEESKTAEFGGHNVEDVVARRMRNEDVLSLEKVEYRASRAVHMGLILVRFLDGSILVKKALDLFFRRGSFRKDGGQ